MMCNAKYLYVNGKYLSIS